MSETNPTPVGPEDEAIMDLLAEHVPITLLVDLADAPASEELLLAEGLPEDSWWENPSEPEADAS